jgi:hypothetical protein
VLRLSGNGAQLPPLSISFCSAPQLRSISLTNLSFTAMEGGQLMGGLAASSHPALTALRMANVSFAAPPVLPGSWAQLAALKDLYISSVSIAGSVPLAWRGGLQSLVNVSINGYGSWTIRINSTIEDLIAALSKPSLQSLKLVHLGLQGSLQHASFNSSGCVCAHQVGQQARVQPVHACSYIYAFMRYLTRSQLAICLPHKHSCPHPSARMGNVKVTPALLPPPLNNLS